MYLDDWIRSSWAIIYPEVCQICNERRANPDDGYVCENCISKITFINKSICDQCGNPFEGNLTECFNCSDCTFGRPHYKHARSPCTLEGPLQTLIHRNKYTQSQWMEPLFGTLIKNALSKYRSTFSVEIVLAVPLYPAKQRERGYNQSTWLAKIAAKELGAEFRGNILKRVKPTETQTRMSRRDRKENMKGAFKICTGSNLANKRLLLVDDVITTGATIDACAKVLMEAGAESVCALTLARGISRPFLTCELPF